MNHLLTAVIFLPAAAAVFFALVPREHQKLIKGGAFVASALTFFLSVALLFGFDEAQDEKFQFVTTFPWVPQLGIQYKTGLDGIGLVMVLLTTLLSAIAIASSFTAIHDREKEYYVTLLLLETGMTGVFASLDLVLFYVFWEAMLIPMYFLIGVWGGPRRVYATIKFVLYTLVGSLLMLVAILVIHANVPPSGLLGGPGPAGTFDLEYILTNRAGIIELMPLGLQKFLFFCFALAFAIKVPVWPLHTWLPDAHTEAPTAGSVILAGVLLKMGTYGFIRYCVPLFPTVALEWSHWLMLLGVIGIVYGAMVALVQRDVKKLVAYSSVSHLGFVMLGIFALTQSGLEGGMLQGLNHGISTGALFLIVGMIYERRHTREIAAFGGLWKVLPVFTAFFMLTMFSSIGLPGMNGFIGEFQILTGAWLSGHEWMTAFAATGIILGACYMLWMFQRVMQGPLDKPENAALHDLNPREIGILVPLVVLMFWIGLFPNTALRLFDGAVARNVLAPVEQARRANTPEPSPVVPPSFSVPGAPLPGAPPTSGAVPGGPALPGTAAGGAAEGAR